MKRRQEGDEDRQSEGGRRERAERALRESLRQTFARQSSRAPVGAKSYSLRNNIITIIASFVVSINDAAVSLLSQTTHVYFDPHFIRFSFVTQHWRRGDLQSSPAAVPCLGLSALLLRISLFSNHNRQKMEDWLI